MELIPASPESDDFLLERKELAGRKNAG